MHKKYIKKKGKKFGPYFYTTIRDKNGIARSYYLSQDYNEALRKEEGLKSKLLKERERTFPVIPQKLYAAAFLTIACLFLFLGANFTGLLVSGETVQYSQELGVGFTQSTNHTIDLQAHPDQFYMNSLRLSGTVIGNGTAKVYLESPSGERFLVLDHSPPQQGLVQLTGHVVESGNETIEAANETENVTVQEEELNATATEQDITANITAPVNETANVTIPEQNITETLNETINITANITAPVNETLNITANITLPEVNITANITEEVNITANITGQVNETLNITANITTENITANITAPVNETINVTIPEQNITANITETLNITANITANVTEEVEIPEYSFSSTCVDTCLFTEDDGFNDTSYRIIIELGEDTELVLDSMNYTAVNLTILVINETEEGLIGIEFEKLQNDPAFEITLDSAELDEGELFIRFHHNHVLETSLFQ